MNATGLRSLINFPLLPNILRLEFQDNKLANIDFLANLKTLEVLNIQNNNFTHIEALQPLANLDKLHSIFVNGNPLCLIPMYLQKIYKM